MNAEAKIRKGRKYDQVLAGARAVFMREGFEGASVDAIARDAGVSKATLYSYFPDKQHLFVAVLKEECDAQSELAIDSDLEDLSVEATLRLIARKMVTFVISEFGQEVFRVCVAEAVRFPDLGRAFYESGPRAWGDKIAGFLCCDRVAAELDIPDPWLAADQLMQLCRTDLMLKVLFGVDPDPAPEEIDRVVDEAVKTFLARYIRRH